MQSILNKKILLSLGTLTVVAAIAIGGTIAFYNDTETSTGNIFTAGSIDLKVDHTLQTYNGVNCKTCDVTVVSNTSNVVVAGSAGEGDPVAFPHPAQLVTFIHPAWTADVDGAVNDAKWIWATDPVVASDLTNDVAYTFEKTFTWMGPISGATLNMGVAADNGYEVYLNNILVGADPSEANYNLAGQDSYSGAVISSNIVQGTNTLKFVVKNKALPGSGPTTNPAGLLYKLTIDGNCGDAYFQNACHLWSEKDLGQGDTFFSFNDVKPGDFGTNVISLHVYDNDAYACLIVGDKDDQENPAQPLGPEIVAGDALGDGNPLGDGELSDFLNVFTWGDTDGDGVYEPTGESSLGSGPLSSLTSIMSMDSLNHQFLVATTTQNIGLAWCAGTLTVSPTGAFTCDGNGMGNIAQSDSFSASLTAYAEQTRNNGDFSCAGVDLPQDEEGNNGESLGPAPVGLLSANPFAIIAETAITDAGNAPLSDITGNIAINPAAGSAVTGLSCTNVTGTLYSSGGYLGGWDSNVLACAVTNPVIALAVRSAMEAAYLDAAGRPGPDGTNLYGGIIGGQTFTPGLYKWTTGVTIPTNVTLSGDANDVWIFQIDGDLTISSATQVVLSGALAKNVFWQVAGPTGATLGTTSTFNGTILSAKQVIIQTGAVLNGRAFAQSQVTLDGNAVTVPL